MKHWKRSPQGRRVTVITMKYSSIKWWVKGSRLEIEWKIHFHPGVLASLLKSSGHAHRFLNLYSHVTCTVCSAQIATGPQGPEAVQRERHAAII